MAKPKGKSRAAAATVSASNVEGASGNNMMIADPAPSSEPVEDISGETAMENAAVPDDKSEGAVDNYKEKGTENDGLDEPEEIDDDEEEDEEEEGEETQDGLDAKLEEEVDDVEEAKDGLDDKSEEVRDNDDDESVDKSDEGDELEEDAKEDDGVVEPVGTDIVPEGSKMVDNDGKVLSEVKVDEEKDDKKDDVKEEEGTTKKKLKRIRIKKKTTAASVAPAAVGTDIVPEGSKMVDNDGKVLSEAKVDEEKDDKKDDVKEEEGTTKKKLKRIRIKKKTTAASVAPAAVSNDASKKQDNADKQGAAAAEKELKKADGMGLVFMCSAKTKQDCYRYKVLGLPASKKEIVAKIYKGMRLFLFDVDLKLMYGIYMAASPGGYNIEPKAFKSAYPAQVRFQVLNDCLPLPEEKFKAAIKENYYRKNKFDCQLSPEQVKKLCRLFQKAGKIPEKRISREVIAEPELPPPARGRQKTRKPIRYGPERTSSARGRLKNREVIQAEPERTSFAHGRKRAREVARAEPEQISFHGRKRSHQERERGRRDDRYARREDYSSPRGGDRLYALPPPPQARAYGRQGDEYYYRRDAPPPPPQPLDPRDYRRDPPREYHRAVELEARPRQPVEYRDAYSNMYREPVPYNEYMASASYAAPPAAGLAPSAYAPNPASLAPSTYAPSSSLYYRY